MKELLIKYSLLLIFVGLVSCKQAKNSTVHTESIEDTLVFHDAKSAAQRIVFDKTDNYFDEITLTDISLQMKKSDVSEDRKTAVEAYKSFLQSEMLDFSEEDKAFMNEVFKKAKTYIDKINPKLYPEKIELYKTKTNHYGENVYYTRERGIIVPANIFKEKDVKAAMPIMLHEIFHILSRYYVDFRNKMYGLIGFEKYEEDLLIQKSISDLIMSNPDGMRRDYAIRLEDNQGKEQLAVPILVSTKSRYTPDMPSFFNYMQFDLYPIDKISKSQVTLGIKGDGSSALSTVHNADFFNKIKDNTQYIIHPDEILADNFMMAVIAKNNGNFDSFSDEGEALLKKVLDVLAKFDRK